MRRRAVLSRSYDPDLAVSSNGVGPSTAVRPPSVELPEHVVSAPQLNFDSTQATVVGPSNAAYRRPRHTEPTPRRRPEAPPIPEEELSQTQLETGTSRSQAKQVQREEEEESEFKELQPPSPTAVELQHNESLMLSSASGPNRRRQREPQVSTLPPPTPVQRRKPIRKRKRDDSATTEVASHRARPRSQSAQLIRQRNRREARRLTEQRLETTQIQDNEFQSSSKIPSDDESLQAIEELPGPVRETIGDEMDVEDLLLPISGQSADNGWSSIKQDDEELQRVSDEVYEEEVFVEQGFELEQRRYQHPEAYYDVSPDVDTKHLAQGSDREGKEVYELGGEEYHGLGSRSREDQESGEAEEVEDHLGLDPSTMTTDEERSRNENVKFSEPPSQSLQMTPSRKRFRSSSPGRNPNTDDIDPDEVLAEYQQSYHAPVTKSEMVTFTVPTRRTQSLGTYRTPSKSPHGIGLGQNQITRQPQEIPPVVPPVRNLPIRGARRTGIVAQGSEDEGEDDGESYYSDDSSSEYEVTGESEEEKDVDVEDEDEDEPQRPSNSDLVQNGHNASEREHKLSIHQVAVPQQVKAPRTSLPPRFASHAPPPSRHARRQTFAPFRTPAPSGLLSEALSIFLNKSLASQSHHPSPIGPTAQGHNLTTSSQRPAVLVRSNSGSSTDRFPLQGTRAREKQQEMILSQIVSPYKPLSGTRAAQKVEELSMRAQEVESDGDSDEGDYQKRIFLPQSQSQERRGKHEVTGWEGHERENVLPGQTQTRARWARVRGNLQTRTESKSRQSSPQRAPPQQKRTRQASVEPSTRQLRSRQPSVEPQAQARQAQAKTGGGRRWAA